MTASDIAVPKGWESSLIGSGSRRWVGVSV